MAESFNAKPNLPIFHVDPPHNGVIEVNHKTMPEPQAIRDAREHIENMQLQRELARL